MGKIYKVEAPTQGFTGRRNTATGPVVFSDGVAEMTRKLAEELVNKGYFCQELDVTRPAPEPDLEEKLQAKDDEIKELTEAIGDLKDNIEKMTNVQEKLKAKKGDLEKENKALKKEIETLKKGGAK